MTISDGNSGSSGGGGISAESSTLVLDQVVVKNSAGSAGAGIFLDGDATITNSTVSGNAASTDDGGGIELSKDNALTLTDSTVSGNSSPTNGGGVAVEGTATIERSTISGNTSGAVGGGIGVTPTLAPGADVEIDSLGTLTLRNSTVSGNSAATNGGGVGNFGSTTVESSTLASNTAPNGANFSTEFVPNLLDPTNNGDTPTASVANSIVALPQGAGANCSTDTGTTITSNDFNLEDDAGKSCQFTATHDKTGVDPLLGPLADNGGATQTRALLFGSPAIDQGNTTLTEDQRGHTRPTDIPTVENAATGNGSDIGAFEFFDDTNPTIAITTPAVGATYRKDQVVNAAYSCSDPDGAVDVASCTGHQGATGVASGSPLDTSSGGTHTFTVDAADRSGNTATKTVTYTVDANVPTVTITSPKNGAVYRQGDRVPAKYSCADADGAADIKSCSGRQGSKGVANGGRVTTASTGSHTFTVAATDQAGNTSSKTVTYRVRRLAADLRLSLSGRPRVARVGGRIGYTLVVSNRGPDTATHVRLTDRLPSQVRLVSARSPHGTVCHGSAVVGCRLGSLRSGGRVTVVLTVRAVRTGHARNTASVRSDQPAKTSGARATSERRRAHSAATSTSTTTVILPRIQPRFTG
jgi:uncharacterized repeat protein (TIGR01451 family)